MRNINEYKMTTTSITQEEFFSRLKEDRFGDIQISVDFEVIIYSSVVTWHHILIKDVFFKEKVIIRDAEINSGIEFENCEFERDLIFHNVKSSNYNSTYNKNNESVCFNNCKTKVIVFEKKCYLDRSLSIKNNCVIDKVKINELKIGNAGLKIFDSTISYIDIDNSILELNFSKSIFNEPIRINSLTGDITLLKNEFKNWIRLWNVECRFSLTFNNNLFRDNFNIEGSKLNSISIIGDTFEKKGVLENRDLSKNNLETYLNKLYISKAKFNEGFDFNGLGKNLNELKMIITPEIKGILNLDNWIIDETIISGINQNLKLLFKNIRFRFLLINDFTNFSDISFDRCRGNGNEAILNLINSDLGSTRFNEFNLKSFKVLRLNNVSIDKIRPSNVNWFEDSQVEIEVHEQTDSEKSRRKREIYRQFKQALKNHGNQIDSLIFQARELKCLRDEFKNSSNYNWGERLIMTVSQSNDYGLNWLKPFWFVILATFLIYVLLLPGISDKILFSFSLDVADISETWKVFGSNFKTFWNLFNPVRRFDLTYGNTIQSDWIYFIDLLHRIFLGIMIFQIIKAFRKYVSN